MAQALLRQTSYADFRITVRNQQALIANFKAFDDEAVHALQGLVTFWGNAIKEYAVDLAPFAKEVDPPYHPGFLKANIEVRFSPGHFAFEVGCWAEKFDAIGENLYAIFQEYGSSRNEPQPFLNPAYAWGAPQFAEDVSLAIKNLARAHGAPGSG